MRNAAPEVLEPRVVLAVQLVSLGELSFFGDFTQSGTKFTADGASQPVQLGLMAADVASFSPLVSVSQQVAFDTANNPDSTFTVSGDVEALGDGSPTLTLFENLNTVAIDGVDLTRFDDSADVAIGPDIVEAIVGADASIAFRPTGMFFADSARTGGDDEVWLQGMTHIDALGVNGSVRTDPSGDPLYVEVENGGIHGFTSTLDEAIALTNVEFVSDNLSVDYAVSSDELRITGDSTFTVEEADVRVQWGGSSSGLVIHGGALDRFDMSIAADIENLLGLNLRLPHPAAITMSYDSSNEEFTMSGDLLLSAAAGAVLSNLQATFGGDHASGLVIADGAVQKIDVGVGVGAELDLFGLTLLAADVHVQYDKDDTDSNGDGILQVTTQSDAGIIAKSLFGASASLPVVDPATGAGGVRIDVMTGEVTVEGVRIEVDDVDLGAFDISELVVEYQNRQSGFELDVTLKVSFPGGWEVTGGIELLKNEIKELTVKFEAGDDNEGIEIADTGLFLTGIDATVQNIFLNPDTGAPEHLQNLVVSGDIEFDFGGSVTLFGETVKFFSASGGFLVDKDQLKLDAKVYLAAISDSNDNTVGLLGEAEGDLILDWARQTYSLDVDATLLGGLFRWDAAFEFDSSRDIAVSAKADVTVPHGIPLIGGKELAELDFLLRFADRGGRADGFVAAWTSIDLLFTEVTVGVQYDFAERKAKVIGSGQIDADNRNTALPSQKTYVFSQPFVVPSTGANQGTFSVDWQRAFGAGQTATLALIAQEASGTRTVPEADFCTDASCSTSNVTLIGQSNINTNPAERHVGVVGSRTDPDQMLPVQPGNAYTLQATFTSETAPRDKAVAVSSISRSADGFARLALSDGAPSDLLVGDTVTVKNSSVSGYNRQHRITEITSSGQVVTDVPYAGDATGGTMSGWTLPQFAASWHLPPPTIAVALPDRKPSGNLTVELPVSMFDGFRDVATVDVYVDRFDSESGENQGFQGTKVAGLSGADIQNGMLVAQVDVTRLLPVPYYVYAVVNDRTNTPVTSLLSADGSGSFRQVFEAEFAVSGNVANQQGTPLSGWTVTAEAGSTKLRTTTDDQGFYGFQPDVFPRGVPVTVHVELLDPLDFVFGDPADGRRVVTYSGNEFVLNYTIDERSAIQGKVFDDQDQDGDPGQTGRAGWTVFLDANDNGVLDSGERHTLTTRVGEYSIDRLDAGTHTVALALMNGSTATYSFDARTVAGETVLDISGGPRMLQHAGTLIGGATPGSASSFGITDHANPSANNRILRLSQTGTDQLVTVPASPDLTPGAGAFSAAGWVRGEADGPTPRSIAGALEVGESTGGWDFRLRDVANFADQQTFATGVSPAAAAVADLNDDGRNDLIVGHQLDFAVVLMNTTAAGAPTVGFAAPQVLPDSFGSFSIGVGDFNRDGKPDLAIANTLSPSPTLRVLLNTTATGAEAASFAEPSTFAVGNSPHSVAVGDINSDGKSDLVVANQFSGDISVLLNTTDDGAAVATFSTQPKIFLGSELTSVAVSDLNGDGKPDLALANSDQTWLSIFLNETPAGAQVASFAGPVTIDVGQGPYSVVASDFNRDGRPDLAVANRFDDDVSVLLNETTPGAAAIDFAEKRDFPVHEGPVSVAVGDFNADGAIDLSVANQTSNGFSVLLNTTPEGATVATFASQRSFAAGRGANGMAAGDFNDDGRPDVAVANLAADTSILLNQPAAVVEVELVDKTTGDSLTKTTTMPLVHDQWYHVAFTYDPSPADDEGADNGDGEAAVSLYVNGISVAVSPDRGSLPASPDVSSPSGVSFNIGDRGGDAAFQPFAGFLDDIRVWDTALTAKQVQAVFQGGNSTSYRQTTPLNPKTHSVTIDDTGFDLRGGNDFGVIESATIGGHLRGNDLSDGGLDAVPTPLIGWTVRLIDASGDVVASTRSDSTGAYLLADVVPGIYSMDLVLEDGWRRTFGPGDHEPVVLRAGDSVVGRNLSAARIGDAQVNGTVIDDFDGDGQRDDEDAGRAGAVVYLDLDDSGDLTPADVRTTSVTAGAFVLPLAGVPDGGYSLGIDHIPGRVPSAPAGGFHQVVVRASRIEFASDLFDFLTTVNLPPSITGVMTVPAVQGKPFRLSVAFDDLDTPLTTHSAVIDWGDGTSSNGIIEESDGAGTVFAEKTYREGGLFDVTLTVTDDSDPVVFTIQPLTAIIAGAGLRDGVLQVIGTDESDRVSVIQAAHRRILVSADFLSGPPSFFRPDEVVTIEVQTFDGTDVVKLRVDDSFVSGATSASMMLNHSPANRNAVARSERSRRDDAKDRDRADEFLEEDVVLREPLARGRHDQALLALVRDWASR